MAETPYNDIRKAIYHLCSCWDALLAVENTTGMDIETDDLEVLAGDIAAPKQAFEISPATICEALHFSGPPEQPRVLPGDLDPECRELCEAINPLLGLQTTESCCGHGRSPFHIWVAPEAPECLLPLLYSLDSCHSGRPDWHMEIYTDCTADHVSYMIEGPVGPQAYEDALEIARVIRENYLQKGDPNETYP